MSSWFKGGVIAVVLALVLLYAPFQGIYATVTGHAVQTAFNHTDFVSLVKGNSSNYTMICSWFIIGAILGLFFGRSGGRPKEEEIKPEKQEEDDEPDDEPDEEPGPIAEENEEVKE
jgi:hypothetical protein